MLVPPNSALDLVINLKYLKLNNEGQSKEITTS
jgi:hypothetical protein